MADTNKVPIKNIFIGALSTALPATHHHPIENVHVKSLYFCWKIVKKLNLKTILPDINIFMLNSFKQNSLKHKVIHDL